MKSNGEQEKESEAQHLQRKTNLDNDDSPVYHSVGILVQGRGGTNHLNEKGNNIAGDKDRSYKSWWDDEGSRRVSVLRRESGRYDAALPK